MLGGAAERLEMTRLERTGPGGGRLCLQRHGISRPSRNGLYGADGAKMGPPGRAHGGRRDPLAEVTPPEAKARVLSIPAR